MEEVVGESDSSSMLLRLAMEGGGIAAWELDPATRKVTWTDPLFKWMGVNPGEGALTEDTFYSHVHPDDLPRIRADVEDSLRTGRPFEGEFRVMSPDHGMRWLAGRGMTVMGPDGKPVRMYGVNFDVTRLKDLEEAEKRSSAARASARTAVEMILTMPDPVVLLDMSLTIAGSNQAAAEMFGMPSTESAGKSILDLIAVFLDEEDGRIAQQSLREIAGGKIPKLQPVNIRTPDGRNVVAIAQAGYLPPEPQHQPPKIVLTFRDITDLQAARTEALRNQTRLRSLAARLASSEEEGRWRVSRQIHDTVIQTLSLTRMKLAALIDRRAGDDGGAGREELEEIQGWLGTAATECRRIVADLNPPLLYDLGLAPALRDLADKFRSLHAVIVTVEEKDAVNVAQRPLRGFLFHATRELMMNAVKHAGSSRINVRVEGTGGGIRIAVQDDGRGFDPGRVEHSPDLQTGFGLFSIKERLDGLGGRLQIDSKLGKGTAVSIFLPLAQSRNEPAQRS